MKKSLLLHWSLTWNWIQPEVSHQRPSLSAAMHRSIYGLLATSCTAHLLPRSPVQPPDMDQPCDAVCTTSALAPDTSLCRLIVIEKWHEPVRLVLMGESHRLLVC